MTPTCLYCKRRMRGDLIGWRPVSVEGRVAGWECPTCIKTKENDDA